MFHKQKTNKISKHPNFRSLATWFVRVDTAILLHYLLRLKANKSTETEMSIPLNK